MKSGQEKMIPVTFMFNKERHEVLKLASSSTRISMSELVRLSVDNLMEILGDPKKPSAEGLERILYLSSKLQHPVQNESKKSE